MDYVNLSFNKTRKKNLPLLSSATAFLHKKKSKIVQQISGLLRTVYDMKLFCLTATSTTASLFTSEVMRGTLSLISPTWSKFPRSTNATSMKNKLNLILMTAQSRKQNFCLYEQIQFTFYVNVGPIYLMNMYHYSIHINCLSDFWKKKKVLQIS